MKASMIVKTLEAQIEQLQKTINLIKDECTSDQEVICLAFVDSGGYTDEAEPVDSFGIEANIEGDKGQEDYALVICLKYKPKQGR